MTESRNLADLLACPRCDRTPLGARDRAYHCAGCNVDFPLLDGIPWLFAEPAAALDEWRGRLHGSLRRLEQQQATLGAALQRPGIRASTRGRLEAMKAAVKDHAARLRTLLAPLGLDALTASHETYLALRTRLPSDQGLMTYYGNVHRDWAWGQEENAASLELVGNAFGAREAGKTLVLGAGAGRLAYDLHRELAPGATVALDFNPLLLFVARRVTRGETVELYEFPIAPKGIDDQAVLRRLAVEVAARPGLEHVLADAHRPPFAKGAFDAVVTPWLVDILPEPFDALAARVNHLLADEGCWVNFGSLSFHDADPALHYSVDECVEVLVENGFARPEIVQRRIPYLSSPASRHGRTEEVVVWCADKVRRVKPPARHRALPDWIVRGTDPVPVSAAFRTQIMTTRIHAFIMSLIDGKRSLKDIAKILADQQLMTSEEAEPALRSFLIKMHEDGRRQSTY